MNKTVKWILIGVGALVGLLILIALCIPLLIDPNDYKDKISQAVEQQTGRELSMPGEINLVLVVVQQPLR